MTHAQLRSLPALAALKESRESSGSHAIMANGAADRKTSDRT